MEQLLPILSRNASHAQSASSDFPDNLHFFLILDEPIGEFSPICLGWLSPRTDPCNTGGHLLGELPLQGIGKNFRRIRMIGRLSWLPWMVCGCSLLGGNLATAQAPARPNATFTMLPAGLIPEHHPGSAITEFADHPHWGLTTADRGGGPIPSAVGMAQPKYGWDAYPYPGKDGAREGRRQGCANPLGCGNFWSDKTFIFGSCRQFFGHGRGCGGWRTQNAGANLLPKDFPAGSSSTDVCPHCAGDLGGRR